MSEYNKITKLELIHNSPVITVRDFPVQTIKITYKDFWGWGNEHSYLVFPTAEYNTRADDTSYVNYYIYINESGKKLTEELMVRIKYFLQAKRNTGELVAPKKEEK